MWTPKDRILVRDFGSGQALSDDQYRLLVPLIPAAKPGGRPRIIQLAEQGHAPDRVEVLVREYRGAFMRGLRDRMIGI